MKLRLSLVLACCVLPYLLCADLVVGQIEICPEGDFRCLDQRLGAACMATPEGATAETCAVWLSELLTRPDVNAPEAQEILGHTYLLLATLSEDPVVRQSYRDQANATFQSWSIEDPTDVRSLYGLSAAATRREQSAAHLRRAVAIDPTDLRAVDFLAQVLLNTSGVPAITESIEIQEYAYAEADIPIETRRVILASSITSHYRELIRRLESTQDASDAGAAETAEAQARLATFIAQARQDLAIDSRLMEIRQGAADDPDRTVSHLSILCHDRSLFMFGADVCVEALDTVVDAALASPATADSVNLADAIGSTLRSLALDNLGTIDREFPGWRTHFATSLRVLMSSGVLSDTVSYAYSYVEREDADARLTTLQRGAELFPDSQDIRSALVFEYILRGMREEAIEQYLILVEGQQDYYGSREYAEDMIDQQIELRRNQPDLYGIER